jgi:hypothetical protein
MFRQLHGFKAQYHYLTLVVAADFDEWRVIVKGPECTVMGQRQFGEDKAKAEASRAAAAYIHEQKHEELPDVQPSWAPLEVGEYLDYRK